MSSSGLAAAILNFRLLGASGSIGATTIEKFDVKNGGMVFLILIAAGTEPEIALGVTFSRPGKWNVSKVSGEG